MLFKTIKWKICNLVDQAKCYTACSQLFHYTQNANIEFNVTHSSTVIIFMQLCLYCSDGT